MLFDRILMLIEIFLLVLLIIQGEFIRYYERGVYKIQTDREKERAVWREQKRKQVVKKVETSISTPTSSITEVK